MPQATAGTLITCDPAVKQVLLYHNDKLQQTGAEQFIIADLDAGHLLVKTHLVELAEDLLTEELERNHYDPKTIE